MSLQINAQHNPKNYLISFIAKGVTSTVSTVTVENMVTGASLSLKGSDNLNLTFNMGISHFSDKLLKIYPNPMVYNSTLEIFSPATGEAKITFYEITGRPIAQFQSYLENFKQDFRISGFKRGIYLISVVGRGYQLSGRFVSNGPDGTINIEKVFNNLQAANEKQEYTDFKGVQDTYEMFYSPGNILKFTGSFGRYTSVVMDIPKSSKVIAFTFKGIPYIITTVSTGTSSTSATSGGTVTEDGGESVTTRGVCWGTTVNPTVELGTKISNGTGTGNFTCNITGLQPFTQYHVRAYATNSLGTGYGEDLTFTTLAIVPALTTSTVSGITRTTAIIGCNITSNGGSSVTTSGICWSTSHNPTIAGSHTSDGTPDGSFTSSMTGLLPGTLYYVRAYATNGVGTAYGNERSFTTDPVVIATLSTTVVSSITSTTAVSGGNITDDGGATITSRGVCWSTTSYPTIGDNLTSNGTGAGTFTSNITGLQPFTQYHVRAYATNSAGTAYGSEVIFTSHPIELATLTTTAVTTTSETSVISGGNITNDGGGSITARGVCWSTSQFPTINDNLTSDGTGAGSFTSNISGLQPLIQYHVRAYATNIAGTAYGNDILFTTDQQQLASVTTTEVTSILSTTAISGGNIIADGGSSITARGVCWKTSANPTINDNKTTNGTGTGSFTSNLTGLTPNTKYYVRAYATNNVGTAYGNEVTFIYITPEINVCKWLNDSPCFLSLSFDDGQPSHITIANILDQYGFKGTFYVETRELGDPGLMTMYYNIAAAGHEIGSHSVNHQDLTSLSEAELLYEIDESVNTINSNLNTICTSFAHPFDITNDHVDATIFGRNLFTRNNSEYYSTPREKIGLDSEAQINDIENFIDLQIANNNCCLMAGHGIDGSGYSPITTPFLNELLTYITEVKNNQNVWVTTLSNGALYESLFYEVQLTSQIDQSNRQIEIIFDCPDKAIYNKFDKLLYSFKIRKSSSWVIQDSGFEYNETDTHYIYTIDLKQIQQLTLYYDIVE